MGTWQPQRQPVQDDRRRHPVPRGLAGAPGTTRRRHRRRRGSLRPEDPRRRARLPPEVRLRCDQHPVRLPGVPECAVPAVRREARGLVGWPRTVNVRPVPSRAALFAKSRKEAQAIEPWLTKNDFRHFKWMKEAATEIQPFHSRSFYSGNAALSLPAHERRRAAQVIALPRRRPGQNASNLIRAKLPGIDDVVSRVPPRGRRPSPHVRSRRHAVDGPARQRSSHQPPPRGPRMGRGRHPSRTRPE